VDERCPVCGSEDVVQTGPLTIEGQRASVTVVHGWQCTLCGNLQVMVPQAVLVRLYPVGIHFITEARRNKKQSRRHLKPPVPAH
jgi:transcription elongation factor Elf1